ncbi:hypothetical protein JTB14_037702 [Gonioctena quinquepunctata]|nr:hypothetical protein JTB14_037702 [Gonioctena quinquepunctata]
MKKQTERLKATKKSNEEIKIGESLQALDVKEAGERRIVEKPKTKYVEAPLPKKPVWDGRSRSHLGYQGERRENRDGGRIQATPGSPPIPYTPPSARTDPPSYSSDDYEGFSGLMNNIKQLTSLVNVTGFVRALKDLKVDFNL